MLAAMDFRNERISLIAISRDTMCEFQALNPDGTEGDHVYGQLALSFSYGDGDAKSCEITKDAVSQIMCDLPIASCSALYLDGLQELNDAVGGVTVTILEDIDYGYASRQRARRSRWMVRWRTVYSAQRAQRKWETETHGAPEAVYHCSAEKTDGDSSAKP